MAFTARRSASALVAAAAALAVGAPAFAATPGDPMRDDNDYKIYKQWNDDNNLDHLFRVAGPDRVDTAIKLMNSSNKRWGGEVIIARSDDFADALSSAPLADVLDAPVLLSAPGNSIDPRVLAAIKNRFSKVTLVGGTGIFTEQARVQLEGMGKAVIRNRGVDRYETAIGIAKRTAPLLQNPGTFKKTINVYLATGVNFPDALAAGAAAADNDGVVLLTKDKVMPESTYKFLNREWRTLPAWANGIEIHTVGGQAEAAARSSIEDIADTNTGADRYATAASLFGKYKNGINKIAVVSGEGFADGVVGGAWVANHDGALLLTNNAFLNPITKGILEKPQVAAGNTDIVVIGGTGSVSRNVSKQIADLMTW